MDWCSDLEVGLSTEEGGQVHTGYTKGAERLLRACKRIMLQGLAGCEGCRPEDRVLPLFTKQS